MAIEKIKSRKFEIAPMGMAQLGAGAAMVIVSLFLGYGAFARWKLKSNVVAAFESYHRNDISNAKQSAEAALTWDGEHTGARELLAKIQCDGNEFAAAAKNYKELIKQGYDVPQVHLGLGVINLKRADRAAVGEDVSDLIRRARDAFGKAGAKTPEADIGRGHCELITAYRQGPVAGAQAYATAKQIFLKVQADLEGRKEYREACSAEGLVDFYGGLGKVLSAGGKYDPAAAAAFRSCYQLSGRRPLPMGNVMLIETQKFMEMDFPYDDLLKMRSEVANFRRETAELWHGQKEVYGPLKEPWLKLTLAFGRAFLRAGGVAEYDAILHEVTHGSGFEDRGDPLLFDVGVWIEETAVPGRTGEVLEKYAIRGSIACQTALNHASMGDVSRQAAKAALLNNHAWMEVRAGSKTRLQRAVERAVEAAKLVPDDYVFNRNVVVAMVLCKRPEKDYGPFLEKAGAAAQGEWAQDFAEVQKFIQ